MRKARNILKIFVEHIIIFFIFAVDFMLYSNTTTLTKYLIYKP